MSSATETSTSNPQQGAKKGKDKNKDLSVLVDGRLAEINNYMATLMGRLDNMDRRLEELESMGDFEELPGEVQTAVNFLMADANKEIQALKAFKAAKDARIKLMMLGLKP